MDSKKSISRITVTDVPLSPMTEAEIDALVDLDVFGVIDEEYRKSSSFRAVVASHMRLVNFQEGDIIVREGDWGSTAYFVVSGKVVIVRGDGISDEVLGRRKGRRKGLLSALIQRWTNHRQTEYRDTRRYQQLNLRGERDEARIYLQDVPAVLSRCTSTVDFGPGQLFGEIAALGRTARTATIIATCDCQLLEMRWQGLRALFRTDSKFRAQVDKAFRENVLRSFLLGSPIFQHLERDAAAMEDLLSGTRLETYGEYDTVGTFKELASKGAAGNLATEPVIAAEGDYPNGLIMIRNGLARVSHRHHNGHRTVNYVSPGQTYGLSEIRSGHSGGTPTPLKYSLRAIGFVSVICVPTPLVEKYLLGDDSSSQRDRSVAAGSLAREPTIAAEKLNQEFLEFLVGERLVNGTKTMLIDLDRCTRCDDCVRACASTHDNNPRFVRQGPIYDNVMVANACMHCQDPVCMIECPTGAISRGEDEGYVEINDLTCIGCKTCANNCPYDAIRMVEIRNNDGTFVRDHTTQATIVKATKCDMCVDQWGGPACQRACPHNALVRIDMRDIAHLADWKTG